jgi:hypothetical protein
LIKLSKVANTICNKSYIVIWVVGQVREEEIVTEIIVRFNKKYWVNVRILEIRSLILVKEAKMVAILNNIMQITIVNNKKQRKMILMK